MIITSSFFFYIADLLGRKKAIQFLAIPLIVSLIVTMFARNKWHFYAARFIAGFGDGIIFCSLPPYIGEITTPTVRGEWGNTPTFFIFLGQFSITVIGKL